MATASDGRWGCTLAYPDGWIEVPLDPGHLDVHDPRALHRVVADRVDQLLPDVPSESAVDDTALGQKESARPVRPPTVATGPDLGGRDPGADAKEVLVELILATLADDAAQGAVLGAHRYVHDPRYGAVHAHLTVWVAERQHPGSVADELAALLDMSRRPEGAVEEPEVDEVSLPQAGPALRVRFLEAERISASGNGDDAPTGRGLASADSLVGPGLAAADDHGDGEPAGRSHIPVDGENDDGLRDIYAVLVDTVTYLVPVPGTACGLWLRFWTPHLALSEQLVTEFDGIAQALVVDPGVPG